MNSSQTAPRSTRVIEWAFAAWCIACVLGGVALSQPSTDNRQEYPGTSWRKTPAATLGWSMSALAIARQFLSTLPPASILVIDHGQVVLSWGDPGLRIKISSIRKSLLSALYGIYLPASGMSLDASLEDLQIDDDPSLTGEEKSATVRMLLEARSGIYHAYVGGTPGMREDWPKRGSHPPGNFWYYNNWDFNALGTIFEKEFTTPIAQAFEEYIARPTGMQDFRSDDMYYLKAPDDASTDFNKSIHPAYHFRLSARDVARFGYLFLRHGNWRGRQLVPSSWVTESTQSRSQVSPTEGYGYLWWTGGFDLAETSFSARGALAKYLVVFPDRDLVIVYLNHAEFPDGAVTARELKRLPSISSEQIAHFLKLILDAHAQKTP